MISGCAVGETPGNCAVRWPDNRAEGGVVGVAFGLPGGVADVSESGVSKTALLAGFSGDWEASRTGPAKIGAR